MTIYGSLEEIQSRLCNCLAVFRVLRSQMSPDDTELFDAMYGACDLLNSILEDFTSYLESEADT